MPDDDDGVTYQKILDMYAQIEKKPHVNPYETGPAAYLHALQQAALRELEEEIRRREVPYASTAYGLYQFLPSTAISQPAELCSERPAELIDDSMLAETDVPPYLHRGDARYDALPYNYTETWVRPGWSRAKFFAHPIDIARIEGGLL